MRLHLIEATKRKGLDVSVAVIPLFSLFRLTLAHGWMFLDWCWAHIRAVREPQAVSPTLPVMPTEKAGRHAQNISH